MFMWWGGSARDSLSMTFNSWAPGVKTTASGLQYKVLTPGKGKNPTDTDVALINYEGKLLDGTTFDKSQQPTPMPIKGVVPGFSEALKLMSKGAKFRVWIPAKLGYGDKGAGPIPANATLVFDIELIDFLPQAVIEQYQQQMMQKMGGAGGAGGPPGAGGAVPGGEPAPTSGVPAPAAPTGK
nr:FKBP-type peptidyl-prolyl cis-trans isomerase [Sphingomonas asaccharolytica]